MSFLYFLTLWQNLSRFSFRFIFQKHHSIFSVSIISISLCLTFETLNYTHDFSSLLFQANSYSTGFNKASSSIHSHSHSQKTGISSVELLIYHFNARCFPSELTCTCKPQIKLKMQTETLRLYTLPLGAPTQMVDMQKLRQILGETSRLVERYFRRCEEKSILVKVIEQPVFSTVPQSPEKRESELAVLSISQKIQKLSLPPLTTMRYGNFHNP